MSRIAMSSPAAPLLEHLLQPLAQWLTDPLVEDLAINQPHRAWVHHGGAWEGIEIPLTLDDLEEIAILAAALRKQEVGGLSPLCATELPNGDRLQICLPPAVPAGNVALSIRRHESNVAPLHAVKTRYHVPDDWNRARRVRAGRDLSAPLAFYDAGDLEGFLESAVRSRLNILLCGRTGSGKTTLSKSILAAIDPAERLITIEDTLELQILQPNVVRLLYSKDDLTGASVDSEDLIQASMRLRPDRVLLQELRDDAAWSFLTGICSGHPGSVTTIHGHDAGDAFRRLFLLVKGSEHGRALERDALIELIGAAIDVVVPLHKVGRDFDVGSVWFAADAARRQETAGDLLRAA